MLSSRSTLHSGTLLVRQERDGASQKVARLAFGGILTRAPRADVRKVLLLPQRVQEPLGRLRLQAQPVQHAGLPLFCRWGASHPDSGCRAERGLTRGTQRECDPDLCLHVSVHVARRPRLRYSKMSSSAVRSVPAPGRGCGTRSNGRPVASSRLRQGVLHSEKNAVAATSGSKLVSTRSDLTRVGFKTVTEADDCCCLRSVCGLARREFMGGAASSRNLSRSISSSTSTSAR